MKSFNQKEVMDAGKKAEVFVSLIGKIKELSKIVDEIRKTDPKSKEFIETVKLADNCIRRMKAPEYTEALTKPVIQVVKEIRPDIAAKKTNNLSELVTALESKKPLNMEKQSKASSKSYDMA